MSKDKPSSLCDVIPIRAPGGANDHKWVLIEHQLEQCKISSQIVLETLKDVHNLPENTNEKGIASDCLDTARTMRREILGHYTTFLSYLSDTPVSENMGRKEL